VVVSTPPKKPRTSMRGENRQSPTLLQGAGSEVHRELQHNVPLPTIVKIKTELLEEQMKETSQAHEGGHISLEEIINLSDDEVVKEVASQQMETLAAGTHMTPHKTPTVQTILEEIKQVEAEKEKSPEQIAQEMGLDTLIA